MKISLLNILSEIQITQPERKWDFEKYIPNFSKLKIGDKIKTHVPSKKYRSEIGYITIVDINPESESFVTDDGELWDEERINKRYIYEIQITNSDKRLFANIVRDFRNINNELEPHIKYCYRTGNFDELYETIAKAYKPFYKKWEKYSCSYESFLEWLEGIKNEKLPLTSSGSYATGLIDEDWLFSVGKEMDLTNEETQQILDK